MSNRRPYTICPEDYSRINVGKTGPDWEPDEAEKYYAQIGNENNAPFHLGSTKKQALLLLLDGLDDDLNPV